MPNALRALLQHVHGHIEQATRERQVGRLVRFVHNLSPRITEDEPPRILGSDLNVLRSLATEGLPDEVPALRAAVWKLVLGYLPPDFFRWDVVLADARETYATFVLDLQDEIRDLGIDCTRASSREDQVGRCAEFLDQVNKDIFRTRSDLDFFGRPLGCGPQRDPALVAQEQARRDSAQCYVDVATPRCHYDALARVLLVYARLNPVVSYVQGMNEVCAPLYYVFAQDPLCADAEADTFFCFSALMSHVRDAFVKGMDHTDQGLFGQVEEFSALLRRKDLQLWTHLDSLQVAPVYYAVRWLTLLLTQELELPDVLRLWDALLSDHRRPHPLIQYVCVVMITRARAMLLVGDFSDCLHVLQQCSPLPLEDTLSVAGRMRWDDLVGDGCSGSS